MLGVRQLPTIGNSPPSLAAPALPGPASRRPRSVPHTHQRFERVSQPNQIRLAHMGRGTGFERRLSIGFAVGEQDRANVPRMAAPFERLDDLGAAEITDLGGQHDRIGRLLADSKETVKWVGVVVDVERAAQGIDDSLFGLVAIDEHGDAWALRVELIWNRVSILPQEIEHVRAPKPEMSAWRAKMRDLTSIGPVVNRLQIDLAEASDLRRREQVFGFAGSSDHLFWVAAPLMPRQGIS